MAELAYDDAWLPFLKELHGCGWYRELERAILTEVALHGRRVLVVGCGPGYLVRDLLNRGARVTAVDPDPEVLGFARSIAPRAELRDGDTHRLPPGKWELGVMLNVLHLTDDPQGAVAHLASRVDGVVRLLVGRPRLAGGASKLRRGASKTEYATFQRWRAILHQHVPPGPRGLRIICQPHLHELKIQDINGIATLVSGYSGS